MLFSDWSIIIILTLKLIGAIVDGVKTVSSPPRKVSVSADGVGDKGAVGGSVVVVGSGAEVGLGCEVGTPVSDTLVGTSRVVVVVASVKSGGGMVVVVGREVEVVMGGIEIGLDMEGMEMEEVMMGMEEVVIGEGEGDFDETCTS